MIQKGHIIIFVILIILVISASVSPVQYVKTHKAEILQKSLVQRIIPLYHSLRKIPDVLFIPATIATKSNLPKYELFIAEKQNAKLNAALGDNPFDSLLGEENKVWVRAEFRSGTYRDNVKVKYRGQLANHWNSYKKSYTIKFPKDHLFNGMREMSLVIPIDRLYFATSLNNYRAEKMGQLVPEAYYARLSVNGSAEGVMLVKEHWSQEWIEKNPISSLSTLYGVDTYTEEDSVYTTQALPYWKSWNNKDTDFSELKALIELIQYASDEEFKRIAPLLIDLESFYAQDTLLLLTGGYHLSDDGNNLVLIFDATEGRFKAIPYNAGLSMPEKAFIHNAPLLQQRIWAIPEFAQARDNYFQQYVSTQAQDDLEYVDAWIEKMKKEFYRDNAKLENNFMFKKNIQRYRDIVAYHLENASTEVLISTASTTKEDTSRPLSFTSDFRHLIPASMGVDSFIARHPNFIKKGNGIVLPRGTYYFNEDIIIPPNTTLSIQAGTKIFMGPEVSLLSYSPIHLKGTKQLPITITSASDKAWGSLIILNTKRSTSTVTYTSISGGEGTTKGGVLFSGMLAAHNADIIIQNTTFINVPSEDALNIKGGEVTLTNSIIYDTFSDGLDLDYPNPESRIANNTFTNVGGDAIDISWTQAPITNNTVDTCTDKGISIGERSSTTVQNNNISNCAIGIAIKDQSKASIIENTLTDNHTAISLYQKKPFFGGATALLDNNTIRNNTKQIETDTVSSILYKNNGTE